MPPEFDDAALFSADLDERFAATERFLATRNLEPERFPRGCWGSRNAFLVLVGPSPGREKDASRVAPGGPGRPIDHPVRIGVGLAANPFGDPNNQRAGRWNHLMVSVLGSDGPARSLTALFNLDWGNQGNASDVKDEYLALGVPVVWSCLEKARPRVVVCLTKKCFRLLADHASRVGSLLDWTTDENRIDSFRARLSPASFETVFFRSPNHPSRTFLTREKIGHVGQACGPFLRARSDSSR